MNASNQNELIITRDVDVPAEKLFQGWTNSELLKQWFCPKPWGVSHAELDVRPGGTCLVVMRSPDGQEFPNPGVYLEVVPNRKLVFTDAFTKAWEPSAQPFMTGIVEFEDLGGGRTRYTARARHWTAADREKHEAMGFHAGWNQALDQLLELVGTH